MIEFFVGLLLFCIGHEVGLIRGWQMAQKRYDNGIIVWDRSKW